MNDAQFFHRALFDIILFCIIQVINKYKKWNMYMYLTTILKQFRYIFNHIFKVTFSNFETFVKRQNKNKNTHHFLTWFIKLY